MDRPGGCSESITARSSFRKVYGRQSCYVTATLASNLRAPSLGNKLTEALIEEAASVAYRPAKPLDNTDLTHAYRKKMARVYVARALKELASAT